MKETLEELGGFFPTDAESAEVEQPADGAFHGPTTLVAAKGATVLGDVFNFSIGSMRGDHFDSFVGQHLIQRVAVVGFVSDDSFRQLLGEHEFEEMLDQPTLMGTGRSGTYGHRKPSGIDQNHDFNAFSGLSRTDAIATSTGSTEGSIDKAFVKLEAVLLFNAGSGLAHEPLKDPCLDPLFEPSVNRAFGAEFFRQVFPLGSIVQDPEDPAEHPSLVGDGPPTPRVGPWGGHPLAEPIQLLRCKL